MDTATSYEEWREAAIAHDKASGVAEWVQSDESKHFDHVDAAAPKAAHGRGP